MSKDHSDTVTMGPVSHSHEFDLPKKIKALGLRHALSSKAKAGSIIVLDEAKSKDAKTGALAKQFDKMKLGRALVIDGALSRHAFSRVDRVPRRQKSSTNPTSLAGLASLRGKDDSARFGTQSRAEHRDLERSGGHAERELTDTAETAKLRGCVGALRRSGMTGGALRTSRDFVDLARHL